MGPIRPLPKDLDLSGKSIIITGASAGLGLECARQMLVLKASTLVLAVRDVVKGEAVKKQFLADPEISKANPNANIHVLQLDLEDYASITAFRSQVEAQVPVLDILILNAGGIFNAFQTTPHGHEKSVQVNYVSNALLLLALLPLLESSGTQRGTPSRVTWIGSRMSYKISLAKQNWKASSDKSALGIFDTPTPYNFQTQYSASKFLCAAFFYVLTSHVPSSRVTINMLCPGAVKTELGRELPWYMRIAAQAFFQLKGHPVREGAWCYVYAAAVAGAETHGRMLGFMDVEDVQADFLTGEGRAFQKKLWQDTLAELRGVVEIPRELLNA